jgi:hypothetical protein
VRVNLQPIGSIASTSVAVYLTLTEHVFHFCYCSSIEWICQVNLFRRRSCTVSVGFAGLVGMAVESESCNCDAWAARDPSGILSPYRFTRR